MGEDDLDLGAGVLQELLNRVLGVRTLRAEPVDAAGRLPVAVLLLGQLGPGDVDAAADEAPVREGLVVEGAADEAGQLLLEERLPTLRPKSAL